jgi:general secretion pathway protein G
LKTHTPESHTRLPAFHNLRIKDLAGSFGKRLASSRSVEITGFTLIELLIVMAIIATLSTIGFYQYSSFIERTKVTKAIADIQQIAQLVEDFNELHGRYPNELSELNKGEFKDPWGNAYEYVLIGNDTKDRWRSDRQDNPINTYFDLWSRGSDGESKKQVRAAQSRDDIIRAWDGSFVGLGKQLDELDIKKQEEKDKGKGKDKDTTPPTTAPPTTMTPTTTPPDTTPPTTDPDKGKGKGK